MAPKKAAPKKAAAKKAATPKPPAPKKSNTMDSSKLTRQQGDDFRRANKYRTDTGGRSGMGETATSNIRPKVGGGTPSAVKAAMAEAKHQADITENKVYNRLIREARAAGNKAAAAAVSRRRIEANKKKK
jgi:hypothetical protein